MATKENTMNNSKEYSVQCALIQGGHVHIPCQSEDEMRGLTAAMLDLIGTSGVVKHKTETKEGTQLSFAVCMKHVAAVTSAVWASPSGLLQVQTAAATLGDTTDVLPSKGFNPPAPPQD